MKRLGFGEVEERGLKMKLVVIVAMDEGMEKGIENVEFTNCVCRERESTEQNGITQIRI